MNERKNFVNNLERAVNLAYGGGREFIKLTIGDVKRILQLIKEQETVPADNGKCPSCNWDFENGELDFSNINESRFYCPRCGQAVKLNES